MNENSIKSCTSIVLIPWGASGRSCTTVVVVWDALAGYPSSASFAFLLVSF
jgi:hypothetical protein